MTIIRRNGKVQIVVTTKGKPKPRYQVRELELERGKIRKAIEDRKIEQELLEADPW